MACEFTPKTQLIIAVINCSIGIILGIIVCLVFGVLLENRNGIPWGLLSVVFATLALIQFLYLYKQKRVNRVSPNGLVLCLFGTAGSIATAIGIGGMGTYLGLGIVDTMSGNERGFTHSHYIVVLWCFDTFTRGLTLYWYALKAFNELSTVTFTPTSGKNT